MTVSMLGIHEEMRNNKRVCRSYVSTVTGNMGNSNLKTKKVFENVEEIRVFPKISLPNSTPVPGVLVCER